MTPRDELLVLQRKNRAFVVQYLDDYKRLASYDPGTDLDARLMHIAICMLIGDVLSFASKDLYINAGN